MEVSWKTLSLALIAVLSLLVVKDVYLAASGYADHSAAIQTAAIANQQLGLQNQRINSLIGVKDDFAICFSRVEKCIGVEERLISAENELATLRPVKSTVAEFVRLAIAIKADFSRIDELTREWNAYQPTGDDAADVAAFRKIYDKLSGAVKNYETHRLAYTSFRQENAPLLAELGGLEPVTDGQMDAAFSLYKRNLDTFGKYLQQHE